MDEPPWNQFRVYGGREDPETQDLPAVKDSAADNVMQGWTDMQAWLDQMKPDDDQSAAA